MKTLARPGEGEGWPEAMLEIRTADEFFARDVQGRWTSRRAAREAPLFRRILHAFLLGGGPIPVDEIVAGSSAEPAGDVRRAMAALDADDLIRIQDGRIDVAYPFSASPTPFVVDLPDGTERHACCAMDALCFAPMVGQPLDLSATPDGPGPDAAGIMLWLGARPEDDRCKVADSF